MASYSWTLKVHEKAKNDKKKKKVQGKKIDSASTINKLSNQFTLSRRKQANTFPFP